ncbi:Outer membrane lipoprotein LolB [Rhodococcus sp. AW25M09]|uniref:hypothetical protein n=1 Tax=Rhodococcus sp. AW25M09 TaxID=1268303 RepID=UPI0002AC055C|nr:hypothetical protein [Rhodococcus sp. AW25M09]CCQ14627.1 Outer membrane lipoprotein LolB [Rhodococcus sp. AW25M09]
MHRDGRLLWLHLVYGDGWSAQWWNDEPTDGEVTLTGTFNAMLTDFGVDAPPRVHGRIRLMHLVDEQVRPTEKGWTTIDGTDQLTEIDAIPVAHDWWPSKDTKDGDFIASGVLIEIDLDDHPSSLTPFAAGAVTIRGDSIWVMHSSEPVLLQVDTAGTDPVTTRYLLPLTIEPSNDRWSRRIHAIDDGLWLTSEHDIHLCTISPEGELSIERYATEGSWSTAVHEGQLYLMGRTRSSMNSNRRHGVIRTYPDEERVRLLDRVTRRIVTVDGPDGIRASRADRATAADGTQWSVDGTNMLRRIDSDGTASKTDLTAESETVTVRSTTSDAFADPANADVVAAITVDVSRFVPKTPPSP